MPRSSKSKSHQVYLSCILTADEVSYLVTLHDRLDISDFFDAADNYMEAFATRDAAKKLREALRAVTVIPD